MTIMLKTLILFVHVPSIHSSPTFLVHTYFLIYFWLICFRYVHHFVECVPFPSARKPRILIQLDAKERISLAQPEDLPINLRLTFFWIWKAVLELCENAFESCISIFFSQTFHILHWSMGVRNKNMTCDFPVEQSSVSLWWLCVLKAASLCSSSHSLNRRFSCTPSGQMCSPPWQKLSPW